MTRASCDRTGAGGARNPRARCETLPATRPTLLLSILRHSTMPSGTSPAANTAARCDPGARRLDQEQRDGEQREIEQRVQQDRRQQSEPQEDRRPEHRRQQELDEARIRRKARVVRVRASEDHGLQHERDGDAQPAAPEMRADERAERKRNRAKQAFLHESRLQRNRDGHQRRHGVREDVGIGQHFGRLPPAEPAVRRVIEAGDERQLERHEAVAAERAAEHRARRAAFGATTPATIAAGGGTRAARGFPPP